MRMCCFEGPQVLTRGANRDFCSYHDTERDVFTLHTEGSVCLVSLQAAGEGLMRLIVVVQDTRQNRLL